MNQNSPKAEQAALKGALIVIAIVVLLYFVNKFFSLITF
ncbi:hypothetical protein Q361_11510 [Flavobacterium croceum DSM 17960]|uniref:Uncharacterized protein n=1 Tax=Flavobacterium croceum DSM 17960 TaxID=1121886 RepID=A0A2S4N5J8_9FLAO|nr:hypothetical protein Q361_11510 [Flavobacterium croceum DSM 17960]